MPCSPLAIASSASSACFRASYSVIVINAWSWGSNFFTRAKTNLASSTADTCLSSKAFLNSLIVEKAISINLTLQITDTYLPTGRQANIQIKFPSVYPYPFVICKELKYLFHLNKPSAFCRSAVNNITGQRRRYGLILAKHILKSRHLRQRLHAIGIDFLQHFYITQDLVQVSLKFSDLFFGKLNPGQFCDMFYVFLAY